MNKGGHLTERQLSDYFGSALEKKQTHEIGRHLLQCDFCLKRLPKPTTEQLWAALMTENDVSNPGGEKIDTPLRLGFVSRLITPPKFLAWSAGGLAIVLIFMVLMWFSVALPSNEEKEVAQLFDTENAELKENKTVDGNIPQDNLISKPNDPTSSSETSRAVVISKPKNVNLQNRDSKLPIENNLSTQSKKIIPSKKLANISMTRGGSTEKCSEEDSVEMEFGSNNNEAVVFRWTKVPNAIKYHLYISDDDEILIDEYETGQDTTYILKKPLDPAKTYKWKVIITLDDGQTKSGTSQKFTVKDVLQNQKKMTGKKKSDIRCSENK